MVIVLALAAPVPGCSGDAGALPSSAPDLDASAHDAGPVDAGVPADAADAMGPTVTPCPSGHVPAPLLGCMPVGIQGCAAEFLDADGLCRPSIDRCPAGTIPDFEVGCAPVGPAGCAAMWVREDGLCRPTAAECAAPTIPDLMRGCVPVGLDGCHGMFVAEDGHCDPRAELCPAGTIPDFDDGCAPVGVAGCASAFVGEDGQCRPRAEDCPPGHFPAPTVGCVPIDGPAGCGEPPWGSAEPAPGDLYVDAGARAGGDGSQGAPFSAVAEALAAVASGGRVVLAAGVYDEVLAPGAPVELVGRCASLVSVGGLEVAGGIAVSARGLTIAAEGPGVVASGGATLTLDHVRVLEAVGVGLWARGAGTAVALSDGRVDATRADVAGLGLGVHVEEGAHLVLERVAILGSVHRGILAQGATAEITGSHVEGTVVGGPIATARAIQADSGAQLTLTDSTVVANDFHGLGALDPGTLLAATRVVVAECRDSPEPGRAAGHGALALFGAELDLDASALLDNTTAGVTCADPGTLVQLHGSLIAGTQPEDESLEFGRGVTAQGECQVVLEGCLLRANHEAGVAALEPGSVAEVASTLIQGTRPRASDGNAGVAAAAQVGGEVRLSRVAIVGGHASGVAVHGAGSRAEVIQSCVREVLPRDGDGTGGTGIDVIDGAAAWVEGCLLSDLRAAGITVATSFAEAPQSADAWFVGNLVRDVAPGRVTVGDVWDEPTAFDLRTQSATFEDNVVVGIIGEGIGATGLGTTVARRNLFEAVRVTASAGAELVLEDNVLLAPAGVGVWSATHSDGDAINRLTMVRNLIWHAQEDWATEATGSGVWLAAPTVATLTGDAVVGGRYIGVGVGPDATAALDGVLVRDLEPGTEVAGGVGVVAFEAASASLRGCAITGVSTAGAVASGAGASLELTDTLIEDVRADPATGLYGFGVSIQGGAVGALTSAAFRGNRTVGVVVDGTAPGATVTLEGCWIGDTQGAQPDAVGVGLHVRGASAEASSLLVEGGAGAGVAVVSAALVLAGSLVRGVASAGIEAAADGEVWTIDGLADGVAVATGSSAELEAIVVEGCGRAGVVFEESGGALRSSRLSGNLYGLVLQGSQKPWIDVDNQITGNALANWIEDGEIQSGIDQLPLPGVSGAGD